MTINRTSFVTEGKPSPGLPVIPTVSLVGNAVMKQLVTGRGPANGLLIQGLNNVFNRDKKKFGSLMKK